MALNCKPGDLALVIGGTKGHNLGKTCTVIRLLGEFEHLLLGMGPVWLVDRPMTCSNEWVTDQHPWAPDRFLMPIRDPGEELAEDLVAVGSGAP